MFKKTGKKIEVDEKVLVCDFCESAMNEFSEPSGGLECSANIHFDFGYLSNRDGDLWTWDLCNKCADEAAKILEKLKNEKRIGLGSKAFGSK